MSPSRLSVLRSPQHREDGASLLLTMILVVLIGLSLTALLDYAGAGIKSARSTGDRQSLASDTSAAMDLAIDALRKDSNPTGACPALPRPVPLAGRQPIQVACQPKAGTGTTADALHITTANRPASAVLALAPLGTETGLANTSGGILRIRGKVDVDAKIAADNPYARIEVDKGPIVARGSCPLTKLVSTVSVSCTDTSSPTADPGSAWSAGTPDPPVPAVVPTTCPASGPITLTPGYYDDAAALTNLTNLASGFACDKPLLFTPGVYYFDFRNEEMADSESGEYFPSGDNVWTINNPDLSIVGGTAKDWVGGRPTIPGSCVSPLTTADASRGVQLVFGGSSRMNVVAGKVELCGRYSTAAPSVVVQGSTATPVPTTTKTVVPALAATQAVAPDLPFITTGSSVTVPITHAITTTTTARVLLSGMNASTSIPRGSVLVKATLKVVHEETNAITVGVNKDKATLTAFPNPARTGSHASATPVNVPLSSTQAEVNLDMTRYLKPEVWTYGLSDLRLDYAVTAAKSAIPGAIVARLYVDPLVLTLTWTPPSVRGERTPVWGSNCVGAQPPTCALLTTQSASQLYVQGTTYAPYAAFAINAASTTAPVFSSGIVARSLSITGTPAAGAYEGPVINLPDLSVVTVEVYLAAYACTGSGTQCGGPPGPGDAHWRLVGRSTVALVSNYPLPPDGRRQVKVLNWHVLE